MYVCKIKVNDYGNPKDLLLVASTFLFLTAAFFGRWVVTELYFFHWFFLFDFLISRCFDYVGTQ